MTAVEWLAKILYSPVCNGFIQGRRQIPHDIIEQAKAMEKERDKKIALHFMMLGIKNKGDFSKIDFYKEIENL